VALAWLLDTNVISDLLRNPQGKATRALSRVGEDSVCTSIIVAAELHYGAEKSQSIELKRRVEVVLAALEVLPLEPPADRHYADIRDHLVRLGTPIGPNDLLIAAHARSLGLTVVTANEREFSRVPGLAVANWLA
jgi:tRNA(fMet)-specific endonuclease VapC